MTKKIIKSSDVLGDNYYIYELSSSNYTPALNGTITITCTVTDVYGDLIGSKSITLYKNGTSVSTKTTNSSGVATWSVTCSTAGIQSFKVGNKAIEVFVDNKSDVGHTHSQYLTEHQSLANYVTTSDSRLSDARTPTSHAHGNLSNDGKITTSHNGTYSTFVGVQDSTGTLYKASKINSDIIIDGTAHANIGSNANDNQSAINTAINTALGNKANSTHSHSLSSLGGTVTVEKLATAESGYLSSYAVKQNGVQVGNTINIPKDFLVKSGSVKTVSTANSPVSGYSVGDKYIDLVINVQEGTSTDSHIYILVSDLVDTPITISDVTNLQTTLNNKIDTAGTGLSKSGTTLNHSNSITALTTASFKKIKYDAQGHITGTADVSASDLPSHTHSPSQVGSGISSADWNLITTYGDGSTQEYFNKSVNDDIGDIWDAFNGVYNDLNNFELVALKTDDISQLTSNTEYYPSAKGVADYVDYIIPLTSLSDFNDDLNYAPTSHATSATTYGASSASNYGHAMASSTSPKANGTAAVGSETAKFARGDHVHPHSCVNNLTSTSTTTPLAANQGKVLNDTKADKSSVVDWDNIVFVDKADDSTGSIILNFLG